jgi:HlyD family secretion protein
MTRSFAIRPLALALMAAGCGGSKTTTATVIETGVARRGPVTVAVEATGVVTPIDPVDVRSKASGQIIDLPVENGAHVNKGETLARIDPRVPTANYNQAMAQVAASKAQLEVTKAQFDRNTALKAQGVLAAPDLEATRLAYANAQSGLVTAQAQLEQATISLEDVSIRATAAGTVIARNVSPGQVIASSTNSPSGGTILLTIADLTKVYDSTLVNESDIGRVRPGQKAKVTVDAYPGRVFNGVVEKINPKATVQQSVTLFPVLIRLENMDGALLPGMNSDVTIAVDEHDDVLTVPVDAIRSGKDATTAATAIGVDPAVVKALFAGAKVTTAGADSTKAQPVPAAGGSSAGPAGRSGRANGASGGGARGAGGGAGAARGGPQKAVVFVKRKGVFTPVQVMIGLTNLDVAEVQTGLAEGDSVALVSSALLQQARGKFQDQIRSRTALPGMGGSSSRSGGAAGGGGGGAGGAAPRGAP